MQPEDRKEFNALLVTAMAVYERQITAALGDLFFAALGVYTIDQVRKGIAAHLQDPADGRFSPKPADVIRQIMNAKASDGRPGRDEAWSIAQRARDESETVMVSEEILGALEVAQPLLDMRDKVAARMAFVEAYDRLVAEKRSSGQPFEWSISLGTDKSRRGPAIEAAKVAGLLPAPRAAALLEMHAEERVTADGLAIVALIGSDRKGLSSDEMRARWKNLRSTISTAKQGKHLQAQQDLKEAERELEELARKKKSEDQE
jgi:hypothetical protein